QLQLEKILAVRAQGDLVVDAGGHVAEMGGWHVLPRHRLEIEHVDRFLRALDQLVWLECGPGDGVGRARLRQELREHRRAGGGDRACGEELQEPATIVDRHGDLLPPPVYACAGRLTRAGKYFKLHLFRLGGLRWPSPSCAPTVKPLPA